MQDKANKPDTSKAHNKANKMQKPSFAKKLKQAYFLLGLAGAVILAAVSSELGKSGGVLQLGQLTQIGIIFVFFLHGLNLAPKALLSGFSNWRLHVYVQAVIFVLYPLLWLLFGRFFLAYMPFALALGFCFLFTLPCTISSAVAMTGVAKGNIPAAILNTSLSNTLAVVVTPVLLQFFISQIARDETLSAQIQTGLTPEMIGSNSNLLSSITSVAKLLLAPILLGQILRPWLHRFVAKHKKIFGNLDKWIILLIVYNTFSDSIVGGIWHDFPLQLLASSTLLCVVILFVMMQIIRWGARRCHFSMADEVVALFCGATKTLAVGIPMGKVLFATEPSLSVILLPLMLFYPVEMFYCAFQANYYARRLSPKTE